MWNVFCPSHMEKAFYFEHQDLHSSSMKHEPNNSIVQLLIKSFKSKSSDRAFFNYTLGAKYQVRLKLISEEEDRKKTKYVTNTYFVFQTTRI